MGVYLMYEAAQTAELRIKWDNYCENGTIYSYGVKFFSDAWRSGAADHALLK